MKIRTDFVTNSSSSSYITFVFETKNGKQYTCVSDEDDAGFFGGGIILDEFTLKDAINAENGKDILNVISEAYDDLVNSANLDDGLFENVETRESTIDRTALEALPASEIQKITINEDVRTDEGRSRGEVTLDLQGKTEQVEYENEFDGEVQKRKEIRHLSTGETEVLIDEPDIRSKWIETVIEKIPRDTFMELYKLAPDSLDEEQYKDFIECLAYQYWFEWGGPFGIDSCDFSDLLEDNCECELALTYSEYKEAQKQVMKLLSDMN